MQAYTGFAQVYDLFMDNIPYDEWTDYLVSMMKKYGTSEGLVLELGCGTGKVTRRLANQGYDMIGIDNSYDMLSVAIEKEDELRDEEGNLPRNSILYLHQDMREFELYGTVAAVVSICDSMNYITEDEDLVEVFRLVNQYLDTNGLFIFDLSTKRFLVRESLQKIVRKQALSGTTCTMKKNRSMNIILRFMPK